MEINRKIVVFIAGLVLAGMRTADRRGRRCFRDIDGRDRGGIKRDMYDPGGS